MTILSNDIFSTYGDFERIWCESENSSYMLWLWYHGKRKQKHKIIKKTCAHPLLTREGGHIWLVCEKGGWAWGFTRIINPSNRLRINLSNQLCGVESLSIGNFMNVKNLRRLIELDWPMNLQPKSCLLFKLQPKFRLFLKYKGTQQRSDHWVA